MRSTRIRKTSRRAHETGPSGKTVASRSASRTPTPDALCAAFARTGRQLNVRLLKADANDVPYVLVEGNSIALEFVGRLFLAQARSKECGLQLSPKGPGLGLFARGSDVGLYIHRAHTSRRPLKNQ